MIGAYDVQPQPVAIVANKDGQTILFSRCSVRDALDLVCVLYSLGVKSDFVINPTPDFPVRPGSAVPDALMAPSRAQEVSSWS